MVNALTHIIIGIALSECFLINPLLTISSSVLPDIDFLINIPHRTLTHSLLFLLSLTYLIKVKLGKRQAMAVLIGLSSHLITDSLTTQGIQLFYPLNIFFGYHLFNSNNRIINLWFIIISLVFIINKRNVNEFLLSQRSGVVLKSVLLIIIGWVVITSLNPISWPINFRGVICSNISVKHYYNTYQVFVVCGESNITVWKRISVLENNLSYGDLIVVNGWLTTSFGKPEINYVSEVRVIEV